MFFLHIQRHLKADGWRDNKKLTRSILAAITVIFIINAELTIIREHILAGYKAVSNQLQPSLVDGDHYLGDKFLYKLNGPQRDDIFIIRDNNDNVLAGRLLKLPGEPVPDSSGRRILGEDEYGFATGNNQIIEVLHAHQIQARAIVIYGSYDPLLKAIIWNRTGMIVR
jgi:signal peptidase I